MFFFNKFSIIEGLFSLPFKSLYEISFLCLILNFDKSFFVILVSSHKIKSTSLSTFTLRIDKSPKFPIGVETIYKQGLSIEIESKILKNCSTLPIYD